MAITVDTLKFFQSERMTDNDDGGGQMTATEIVSGADNQIFDDISDVDRAVGDVSIRKTYAAVTSDDTDKYLDAGIVVFRAPADPAVSVLVASTQSFYDERAAIQNYIENYLVRGPRFAGFLYDTQITGARAFTFFCRTTDSAPSINSTLLLLEYTSTAYTTENYSQYVRITRILRNEVQAFYVDGSQFSRRIVVCEISEALRYTFHGAEISKNDNLKPLGVIYSCTAADAARYYGLRPLTAQALSGDLSVYVDQIYGRIVPTSQIETPILDFTAAAARAMVFPSSATTVSFTVGDTIGPGFALAAGRPIVPGTLTITVSGGTLTDDGGQLRSGATAIGTVDYTSGEIEFSTLSPTYTGSKTVTFQPGGALLRPTNSFGLPIEETTRYRTYVASLQPVPQRGSLQVDYLSQGNWYRLQDNGNGILAGAAESYGAGTINFNTGSVSVTLGALPDLYSSLLFQWASGSDVLSTPETINLVVVLESGVIGMVPGSVTLTHGETVLTDQGDGSMTGAGGSATINYATGVLNVTLTTLPDVDDTLVIAGDRWAETSWETEFIAIATDTGGVIAGELTNDNLIPGSLQIGFVRAANSPATVRFAQWFTAVDDGENGWTNATGTINYTTGEFTLDTTGTIASWHQPDPWYSTAWTWRYVDDAWVGQLVPTYGMTAWTAATNLTAQIVTPTTVAAHYRVGSSQQSFSIEMTAESLTCSLKQVAAATLISGSLRFVLGNRVYYDLAGRVYYGFNPVTGNGTEAGTVDAETGQLVLTDWPASCSSSAVIQSRAERMAYAPATFACFRTPSAPVAVGSFSFRVTLDDDEGTLLEASADTDGVISGNATSNSWGSVHAYGRLDYQTGTVLVYFGDWVVAASHQNAPWYNENAIDDDGNILYPRAVLLDTLLYNCVTYSSLPLDSTLIGLDPVRLPSDGQIVIYRPGQLVLVHHTDTHAENSLSPTQQVDMGRVRLYRVAIDDANGQRFPDTFYSVNRDTGIVTMASDLNLTGYTAPYTFRHTVADLSVVADADLSGRLTLSRPVSHTYPASTSGVSGVLYVGTLQARYAYLFAQSAWTDVWSNSRIGSTPLAQYNDTLYPIGVSNLGTYSDRILIKFTSSTAFQVIGEQLGLIATGNTSEHCAPVNPLTGQTYFTIDYRGWGAGWATGYCLRFNLISAAYPIDLIRAIQPSNPSALSDSVELLFIGNVDNE